MRVHITDVVDQFPFERVPVGVHEVPATIELDNGEVINTKWLVELTEEGTLYHATGTIKPDGSVEGLYFWHKLKPSDKKK